MARTKEQISKSREQLKEEFAEHFGPLYKNRKSKIIQYIKHNPKKSFLWMLLLLGLNFCLMVFLDTREITTKDPIRNMKEYLSQTSLSKSSHESNMVPTFNNIMILREIQDSLKYYSKKENLVTLNDTTLLKGLLRRYASIDPSIFKTKTTK